MNLWHCLHDTAARTPERIGADLDGAAVTYGELHRQALAVAAGLRRAGVAPGDRVAVLALNTVEYLLAYFGAAAAGAILVPLNHRLHEHELRDIGAVAGVRVVLHDAAFASPPFAGSPPLLRIAGLAAEPIAGFAPQLAAADDTAQLYFTSGTTGRPKGVMLSHRNVVTHAQSAVAELGLHAGDRWAHIAPMFHLADAWATFAISMVGGMHLFLPKFTAGAALDLLERGGVTITNLVPTMLNLMVKEPGAAARRYRLRAMLSGGAPIAPAVVRQILDTFRGDYVQTYGMTETSPYLTLSLLVPALQALPPEQQLRWKCKTGRPFRGVELKVVDEQGVPVPHDGIAVGEIRVRGETVTTGYWRDAAATAAAFDPDGFLRTGDLATIDEHGYVDIVDRSKDVIKTGGEAVYSTEVENVLYQHPAVLECAVFGVPDPTWGEQVTAAVVLRPGAAPTDAAALIAFCRDTSRTTRRRARCVSRMRCRGRVRGRSASGCCGRAALRADEPRPTRRTRQLRALDACPMARA